jgi:hypothetical protein
MSFFCLLWVPLFYFFRRSISAVQAEGTGTYGKVVWALLLGTAIVILQYFTGPLVIVDGFGLSCWLSAFIDIVSIPVLVPVIIYLILIVLRAFSPKNDIGDFILLFLAPAAALYSITWNSPLSPVMLVLVPLLWTAQAAGIAFFINCIIRYRRWDVIIMSIPGALSLPLIAATSWWAFYSHQALIGFILFFTVQVPALISIIEGFFRNRNN